MSGWVAAAVAAYVFVWLGTARYLFHTTEAKAYQWQYRDFRVWTFMHCLAQGMVWPLAIVYLVVTYRGKPPRIEE